MDSRNANEDLYALLGVPRDASPADITRAWRRLVRAHHPDTAAEPDPAVLDRLAAAYAILRDPARRAAYDQRHQPRRHQPRRPAPGATLRPASGLREPYLRAGPVRWHPLP